MRYYKLTALACFTLLPLATGCGDKTATPVVEPAGTSNVPSGTSNVDAHVHPSEGPHHGTLVELGNEEFHAEVVHDEQSVTVYVLDAAATKAVPIEATELTINVTHDGTPEQFKLVANRDEGDPEGKSSRFVLADAELVAHIDEEEAAPKLMLTINGTPYRGDIMHDHEGHDHEGHDH